MMIYKAADNATKHNMLSFYKSLSLVELITRIVDAGDRYALEEFHNNRTVFCYKKGQALRLIEYLDRLRESATKRSWPSRNAFEVADKAYDMTLDKFNNLPGKTKSCAAQGENIGHDVKQVGSNCCLYFKAFLNHINTSFTAKPPVGELEQEARASKSLQGLVRRNFYFSLLEAVRGTNPLWSRYYWNVNNHKICVWLPVSLKGRKRQQWLEKNISDPNPLRPGERQRVQAIINRKMIRESIVSFDDTIKIKNEKNTFQLLDWKATSSLAKAVAEEKAINIQQQRRSIRALGKTNLKKMIIKIFEDISYDDYKDSETAKHFGLTKATFSRFAGSRWNQTGSSIPDLWRNTAQVLKDHPIFRQVAKDAGFWGKVVTTVERSAIRRTKDRSHD
jgi:hypothetical protein